MKSLIDKVMQISVPLLTTFACNMNSRMRKKEIPMTKMRKMTQVKIPMMRQKRIILEMKVVVRLEAMRRR